MSGRVACARDDVSFVARKGGYEVKFDADALGFGTRRNTPSAKAKHQLLRTCAFESEKE